MGGKVKSEKRRQVRRRRSDALLWREAGVEGFHMARMLESSEDGVAFACRGAAGMRPGLIIEMHRGAAGEGQAERGVVRRVMEVHEDLRVIGAEVVRSTAFPASAEARAALGHEASDGRGAFRLRPGVSVEGKKPARGGGPGLRAA